MRVIILTSLLIFMIQTSSYSQIDYDKLRTKKLVPISIDTVNEDVLIVEKHFATLYFKKSDILQYAKPHNKLGVRIDQLHSSIVELANTSGNSTLTDWWFDYTDEERQRMFGNANYENENKKPLTEFYYVGADLIHDGKFMILDKKSGEPIKKKLRIKRDKGLYGSRYVNFLLPNGQKFWYIITRFGE